MFPKPTTAKEAEYIILYQALRNLDAPGHKLMGEIDDSWTKGQRNRMTKAHAKIQKVLLNKITKLEKALDLAFINKVKMQSLEVVVQCEGVKILDVDTVKKLREVPSLEPSKIKPEEGP